MKRNPTDLIKENKSENSPFTFIDLFAGIGGTRLGFESMNGQCVFTSEWDTMSQLTYSTNFKDDHPINGDIRNIEVDDVPDHDILIGGFPCQPFSIAGVSKKNSLGTPHGFECKTQGTLFFEVERIIAGKRPRVFVLENVKNLERHDKGLTFKVIKEVLAQKLGYHVTHKVIDAKIFLPQHRERIFIVGFRDASDFERFDWDNLVYPEVSPKLTTILHPQNGTEKPQEPYTLGPDGTVAPKYTLTDHLWDYLKRYKAKHKAAGNGFGFGLVGPDDTSRTLSARYYKDGSEILISQGNERNPRRLTPRECARIMGFPEDFVIPVSDTQAYKQFGNSVAVPVVKAVASIIIPCIRDKSIRRKRSLQLD
jgi:DNA (cytosine-5)-methyltransferase 1